MTYNPRKGRFNSKLEAIQMKVGAHMCLSCMHHQPKSWEDQPCPSCKQRDMRSYFPSKTEHHRACTLLTLMRGGKITKLRFHPRYDLKVNGIKIGVYVADVSYYNQNGDYVIEDSKPEKFMTDVAKMKIKLMQAIYGVNVTVPQQQKKGF